MTKNNLFFSIITVVYNGEKTIKKTLESVIAQNYQNYEYIIIDGQSTDATIKIINQLKNDKVKFISEPDNGIYDAMNKGLNLATGDFCIFLGADDVFADEEVLKKVNELIKKQNRDCIYYGNVIMSKDKSLYDGVFTKKKFAVKNICHQAIFYPKSIYSNRKYNTKYRITADYVYNMPLFNKMNYIDVAITIFNNSSGISSNIVDRKFRLNYSFLILHYLGFKYFMINLYDRIFHHLLHF